ncbi:heme lyase CcmF/NrfE family subunit [Pelagibacteraceae bacterium]|nr:heme lyase CcmF/NrfE family subunit [Pelagibacteraceae bacterium]
MYAYITSDFSNFNVFQNSHSEKPLIYKISGTWGNHEGSMLLWISMLSIYALFFSFTKNLSFEIKKTTLLIQTFLNILFSLFIIFTSNPFLVNSVVVNQGLGLNPILQDLGLAVHPPVLYAGYVGYSILFSLSISSLFYNDNNEWLHVAKKWSLISWTLLTAGITLGSYWAYYELGWGGWWFWDPVENISLMPWIAGLALVHSLLMVKGEQILKKWIIFLSVLCFSLSVFGTFLVRSGILTSVHSFASDASRGLFILLIFFIITSFGFLVFFIKNPENKKPVNFLFINKVSALVFNNILMITATLTILLGTIYPIVVEVLTNNRISVGGPYFNSTVIPIMIPGFLLMSIAPILSWQSNKIKNARNYVIGFILISMFISIQAYFTKFNSWGVIGLGIGLWIIIASLISIVSIYKIKLNLKYLQIINPHIAHIGVGIAIIGITCSSVFKNEFSYSINEGENFKIIDTNIIFDKIITTNEKNFQALRANFLIKKNEDILGSVQAGKNYYPVSKMITTEAGIFHQWHRDIYFILGDQKNDKWFIKVYINPFVSLIWFGVIIMIIAGFIGITKK